MTFRKLFGGGRRASRVEVLPDHIWTSSRAKIAGIRKELDRRSASETGMVALVAHFPDVLLKLERIAAEHSGATSVRAMLARQLSPEAAAGVPLDESAALDLIVAERHPLSSMDTELLRFAEALPCRCRIVYHVSLDDPLLLFFGTDRIRTVLDRLGATAEQPLTHPLISQSIRRVQDKLEAESTGHHDADSAAAWLEMNARL